MTSNNPPIAAWAPSTALAKLASRHNNAPCVLTDGPAEFNDVALIRHSDYEALQAESEELKHALAESRANDLTAMGYLNQIRQMVGGDDFPEMVRRCALLRKDAKRYQFVRTRVSASNARGPASWAFHYYQLPKPISNPLAGHPAWVHFDAAIDAAMRETSHDN